MFFKKDQNGLSSAIATSITGAVLLTGVAALAVGDTALKNEDDQRHGVCVTAKWADDESIFSEKCLYGEDIDSGSITPPEDNSGEETPETEDPFIKTASYSCGPMTLDITKKDVLLSKIAEDLINAGKADEVVPNVEGWKVISSFDSNGQEHLGLLEEGDPMAVVLGDYPAFGEGSTYKAAATFENANSCAIIDDRKEPKEGNLISYEEYLDEGKISEGRYEKLDGRLVYTMVDEDKNGNNSVFRQKDISDNRLKDNKYPYSIEFYKANPSKPSIRVLLTEPYDGVEEIYIANNPYDSTSYIQYNDSDWKTTLARTNGPALISFDKDGKIKELTYAKNGKFEKLSNYPTVEEYNKVAGQNWDGKYHTLDDFDLTIPFKPSR